MPVEWGEPWKAWKTPDLILRDWRGRLERLAFDEGERFVRLPGVLGVALIGTVPRGSVWPLSDVDILTVVDQRHGAEVEARVCAEETRCNRRLWAERVPNEVEARYFVRRADRLRSANTGDDPLFEFLARPRQAGIAFKVPGGRILADFEGQTGAFIRRCERFVFGRRFLRLMVDDNIPVLESRLDAASALARGGNYAAANALTLVAVQDVTAALHLLWGALPESISRAVTRLRNAAKAPAEWVGEAFLTAIGLSEDETWRRFAAAPAWATQEQDVLLAVRRGAGEDIDELDATRDLLHVTSYLAARGGEGAACPAWLSARNTLADAGERVRAARSIGDYLAAAWEQRAGEDGDT